MADTTVGRQAGLHQERAQRHRDLNLPPERLMAYSRNVGPQSSNFGLKPRLGPEMPEIRFRRSSIAQLLGDNRRNPPRIGEIWAMVDRIGQIAAEFGPVWGKTSTNPTSVAWPKIDQIGQFGANRPGEFAPESGKLGRSRPDLGRARPNSAGI